MSLALDRRAARPANGLALRPVDRIAWLRSVLLGLTFASSFVLLIEPAPYEFLMVATAIVYFLTGTTLKPGHLALALLVILLNLGFAVAALPIIQKEKVAMWVAVSVYLGGSAVFLAAAATEAPERIAQIVTRGYLIAAIGAAAFAVIGYLGKIETLTLYGRASATFKDPNVLGPFLVLPAVLLLQRLLTGTRRQIVLAIPPFLLISVGLFLTFSRGAWGVFVGAAALSTFLTFASTRDNALRLRIVLMALLGIALLVVALLVLLSFSDIDQLFLERASLTQSYDTGRFGRFGRYLLGLDMVLDRPLGLGPLEFAVYFPELPHNTFLNALVSGGWLSGFVYPVIAVSTAWIGFKAIGRATPWRPFLIACHASYIAIALEAFIIDIDHWRHYWALIGLVWGLSMASLAPQKSVAKRVARPGSSDYSPPRSVGV